MARRQHIMYDLFKRFLDLAGATIALLICAPLLILAFVLIKLDGGPIFFRQKRVGANGKMFVMLKLRTMVPNAQKLEINLRKAHAANGGYGENGNYHDPRITKVGAILRLLNVDELPQLLNIIKGDMSLIGPRPVPYEESLYYGRYRKLAFSIKPGLTGFWQVKRRMTTNYNQRVRMDCFYVKKRNLLLDAYILFMTPVAMLTSDYNSLSKPLPPPEAGVLVSDRLHPMMESTKVELEEIMEDAVA